MRSLKEKLLGVGAAGLIAVGTVAAVPATAHANGTGVIPNCGAGYWCVNESNDYTHIIISSDSGWVNFYVGSTVRSIANDTKYTISLYSSGGGFLIQCPPHFNRNGFKLNVGKGIANS